MFIGFVAVYLVGISDTSFIYKISIPTLNQPYLLALIMSDFFLLTINCVKRVANISDVLFSILV